MATDNIVIRGAREHNLHNLDLELPRDELIVFTGLSGSGKSSLAFDTIYAEGQRRYVESLSAYARQFLGQMDKPDVDFIEGSVAGDLDRPEDGEPEPAVHGRAPSPRFTTTCGFSTPGSEHRIAQTTAARSPAKHPSRSSIRSSTFPRTVVSRYWHR